jgi:cytochrome c biogenesis protein CcdA
MLYTNSFHSFNSLIKNTPYGAHEANFKSLDVEFFVQEGCAECLILRRDYLPALANRYTVRIRTIVSDTHSLATFMRLLERLEASGIKANEPVYMVVDSKQVLSGWGEIAKLGFSVIDVALSSKMLESQNPPTFANTSTAGRQKVTKNHLCPQSSSQTPCSLCLCEKLDSGNASRTEENPAARLFRRFCWPAVAVAGLADGLNPCAFATIVFLTSLLASGGRRGRSVFIGGLAFCVASFVTYFLIGFGLLAALRRLEGLLTVRALVEWGTMAALMILGAFSLLDAWRYSQSGDAGSVRLQLPAGVKRRIRLFARERWGGAAVFGTGLLCGAGVTLLESVCTGQMYLPTLVFMSRDGGGFRAWGMLLLYNILFIVPLFAVFLLGAFGVRSQRLAELTRRHVVPSKILLSLVFFALAVFLLLYALEKG